MIADSSTAQTDIYSVLKNLVLWARSEIYGSAVGFFFKKRTSNIERPTSNYGTPLAFRFNYKEERSDIHSYNRVR